MWRLIDCGTYLWFVKTKLKYHHCGYREQNNTKCKKCSNVDYLIPYNFKEDWICNSCILDIKKLIIKSAF